MIILPTWLLVVFIGIGTGYMIAPDVKKAARKTCHVLTLGHKCQQPAAVPPVPTDPAPPAETP